MTPTEQFDAVLRQPGPILALAPMQDITDVTFLRLIQQYGGADISWTEYFRVYPTSHLDKHILKAVTQNPTGRPVVAQMIGNDIPALVRTARELERHPVAAIDLNLGCPAPVVYKKCAGGGLLREPGQIDEILGRLRETIRGRFTVKTRIGFENPDRYEELLAIFARHSLDLVTVHGRTVREMYRSEVHYDLIARAAAALRCPVLANGNVFSPAKAAAVLQATNARGLMIGRGAIRNPWLFAQIRAHLRGEPVTHPTGRQVLGYLQALREAIRTPEFREASLVQALKRFVTQVALGAEPTGEFLHQIRRVTNLADYDRVCATYLEHDRPLPLEPYPLALKASDVLGGDHS